MNVMYDFEYDGDLQEWEYATFEKCEEAADEWFADMCLENDIQVNETRDSEGYIVAIDDSGTVVSRKKIVLEYTRERSDFDEHRTY